MAGMRPLAMLRPGEEGVIVAIHGGKGFQTRLSSMGLAPGKKVRMISTSPRGPALVAVGDTRLAIGRGQIHRVMVE